MERSWLATAMKAERRLRSACRQAKPYRRKSHNQRHPTELARLRGARLVVAQETEQGKRWAETRLKAENPLLSEFGTPFGVPPFGLIKDEHYVPAFEKAAMGLKEGQLSDVVKSDFGYHIIKLTGKRAAGTRTFEEVKDQIKAAILPTKQQEIFQKIKDELKKSGKYTIKEDALKSLGGTPSEKAPADKAAGGAAPAAGQKAPQEKK